jgi:hypothetical protein
MPKNKLIFENDEVRWLQVPRDRSGNILEGKERTVPLSNDLQAAVNEFVDFSANVGGDPYRSALGAMYDLRSQLGQLVENVDQAPLETDVENSGGQLDRVIDLSKVLEWYYLDNTIAAAGD